jgi:DNA-binding MarR family transcriptional regulator
VPGDRRSYALTLTPEGAALLVKAKAAHARHDRKVSNALVGLDKAALIEALERIASI